MGVELEPTSDTTLSMSEEQFSVANDTVIKCIIDDCSDSLGDCSRKKSIGKAAVRAHGISKPPKIPRRRGIKPEDLNPWKYRKYLNLDEDIEEEDPNLRDEVQQWQNAYEEQKRKTEEEQHKIEVCEKSNVQLRLRLVDCQKKIRAHKQTICKQRKMKHLWEVKLSELKGAIERLEQEKKTSVRASNQPQPTHEELLREHQDRQILIDKLQAEVSEYKRLVAAYSADEDQLADDQIRASWEDIFNRIRNIAVRLCKGSAFDYGKLPSDVKAGLITFVPSGHQLPKEYHIYIVISIISWCLVSLVSLENTFGESTMEPFTSTINIVRHMTGNPSKTAKAWIEATRKFLVAVDPDGTASASSTLVDDFVNRLRDILSIATKWNGAVEREIRAIFRTGFEWSQSLLRQRNEYQIRMLSIHCTGKRSTFEAAMMVEVIASLHNVEGHAIEVSAFPGLYKMNDEEAEVVVSYPKVVVQQ